MGMFEREAELDILPISGTLRVSVHPLPNIILALLEIASGLVFWTVTIKQWPTLSWLMRAFFIWGDASTVIALMYQVSGSEEIEFGPQKVTLRKNIIGWERIREYSVDSCSELEWRPSSKESHGSGLRCKIGWRAIRFAEYISEKQGTEILAALQQYLPEVSRKMGAMPGADKSRLVTLGLS